MILEIKQQHIDEGVQGNPCYCAVSLAVYDALKDKYKFTDSEALDFDDGKEEIEVGESWVETSATGAGVEISIYTKHFDNTKEEFYSVEDFLEIENERSSGNAMDSLVVEDWIEDFDIGKRYVEPISFKVESIRRMNK